MAETIRLLAREDVPRAWELSYAAGWNQSLEDWQRVLDLSPEGCLGIECDGRLVATTTLLTYETRLAWVGLVLTDVAYQRRGYARSLVRRALEIADSAGIESVGLDATNQGSPLYESLGFITTARIERWRRWGLQNGVHANSATAPRNAELLPEIAKLDRHAMPVERASLLESLMRQSVPFVSRDAYLLERAGARVHYLGPCVAQSQEAAEQLIASCLTRDDSSYYWDLFPDNTGAVSIAAKFGFEQSRQLVRMYRGKPLGESIEKIYAIAGFELG